MTPEMRKFLNAIIAHGGACKPNRLGLSATRDQDRARQTAKRFGYVEFDGSSWSITETGRKAVGPPMGSEAYKQLRSNQRQLDMDGCEVGVSRQALEEVLGEIDKLLFDNERLRKALFFYVTEWATNDMGEPFASTERLDADMGAIASKAYFETIE